MAAIPNADVKSQISKHDSSSTIGATPVKTYSLINKDRFTGRHLEFHLDGQPTIWVRGVKVLGRSDWFTYGMQVNLQTGSDQGPIVASMKFHYHTISATILLGDPYRAPEACWNHMQREGWTAKQYRFCIGMRVFIWRRTHNKALGASMWHLHDFKLLDTANENKVLAVWTAKWDRFGPFVHRRLLGELKWFKEIGQDVEMGSLAALWGAWASMAERRRRRLMAMNAISCAGLLLSL